MKFKKKYFEHFWKFPEECKSGKILDVIKYFGKWSVLGFIFYIFSENCIFGEFVLPAQIVILLSMIPANDTGKSI